eukprot:TRINITY_DN39718_c0_g1_i1.p1 TRINITY_DN39718_c0_g1~~TRINITY_DN39718_c0_g1_i1.p1  ORF type:complete len:203 (+),score=42.64 TRINITY_DN39718_c0_g1_i1:151-759(+)
MDSDLDSDLCHEPLPDSVLIFEHELKTILGQMRRGELEGADAAAALEAAAHRAEVVNQYVKCKEGFVEAIQAGAEHEHDVQSGAPFSREGPPFNDARILMDARVDVNIKDRRGKTALIDIAGYGTTEGVKFLLEARANVNAQDSTGLTALSNATSKGHTECVSLLVEARADMNVTAPSVDTLLASAGRSCQQDVEQARARSS